MIEEYRDIEGFNGLYQISNYGNVWSIISQKILKPSFIKGSNSINYGAYCVTLYKHKKPHRRYIHILVCETFISSRPDGMQVRHLDSDTSNNRLDNLQWGTPKENCEDQIKTGNRAYGSRHGISKLTEDDVRWIRECFSKHNGIVKRGWYTMMGSKLGVTNKTIIDVVTRKNWSWL